GDHTVKRPSGVAGCAMTPRGSIGTQATRGKSRAASTTTSASANPRATSPTALLATPATLSGQSSKTRGAPGASARSTLEAAGRGSHVTRSAAAQSGAGSRWVVVDTAPAYSVGAASALA